MADDTYTAAEERARRARRAGLQAKKDEQPANTQRSYAAKQREWKTWCQKPRPGPDGILYTWPDGELVTPDKLAAWLSEDILLRRVKKLQPKMRYRGRKPPLAPAAAGDTEAQVRGLIEAQILAEELHLSLDEAVRCLREDREDYVPPAAYSAIENDDDEKEDGTEGTLYTKNTVDAYISAVIELWRVQVAHGNRNSENPRGAAVRGFLEQRGRQQAKQERNSYKDCGIDGIQAGYSESEWLAIQKHLLGSAATLPQNFRTRIDLLLDNYNLLRGENRRKMELADLSLLKYPPSEGASVCCCLVSLLRDGKMNKTAKKEFMGSIRHRNPLLCTHGALEQLFFWRWHIAGEPAPTFRRRQDWYRIKVLVGQDRLQELSYSTQLQETWKVFEAVGIITAKKTHLPRRVEARNAETYGTSVAQISQAGRWNQSVLCQAYLTHLPREFMRIVAGFTKTPGDYFLPRAVCEPPAELQKQIWPWIDEWEPRFEACARRCRWHQGGLDEPDLAGDGFLKLLRYLRVVLLQDLAVLQPQFPTLPFYSYSPFRGLAWEDYARTVRAGIDEATEPAGELLQRAMPELCTLVESTRSALLSSTQQLASQLANQHAQLAAQLNTLNSWFSGQAPVTITGYLGPSPSNLGPGLTGPAGQATEATAVPAVGGRQTGPPIVSSLMKVYTVPDLWRDWTEGLDGRSAVRDLEARWGSRWRPDPKIRVEFCRRKRIWDAVQARIDRGRRGAGARAEIEKFRDGQSLRRLSERLKEQRQLRRSSRSGQK